MRLEEFAREVFQRLLLERVPRVQEIQAASRVLETPERALAAKRVLERAAVARRWKAQGEIDHFSIAVVEITLARQRDVRRLVVGDATAVLELLLAHDHQLGRLALAQRLPCIGLDE